MSSRKWKEDPVGLIFLCGCREQIKKNVEKPGKRIKKCAQHGPPPPHEDNSVYGRNEPQIPDGASYWR